MAAPARFRLEGAEAMAKVLKAMPAAVAQAELESAMVFAARPVRDEARRLVRKRSGATEKAIAVSRTKRGPRRRVRQAGVVFVGLRRPLSRIAHLLEYGTSHSRAFPFLRPALDSQSRAYFARLGKKLGENLEKTARELAGRFGSIRRATRRRL